MDLPRLTEFGKSYYGCSEFDGIEMENQGGEESLGNHFESRLIREDIMSSIDRYYS